MRIDETTFEFIIRGRVQGVGYRAWTEKIAKNLGIFGWVKNLSDRSVFIVISGNRKNIKLFLSKCYKGPIFSRVDEIISTEKSFKKFTDFEIRY
tara:strand:- start:2291 stop:2572 length:282 start_codon:yes stop_codon:yes gene_type:complete